MFVSLLRKFFLWRESAARKKQHWGPCFGAPEMLKLAKRVRDGDNAAAEAALLIAGNDWERRAWVLDVVAEQCNHELPTWVEDWCEAAPESANAFLVRGAIHDAIASEARGAGTVETVKREAWPVWFRGQEAAKEDYLRAAELNPADPVPWARLIGCAIGLQEAAEEQQRYFDEAVKRDRRNWSAHIILLNGKCKKWGGSHDEMFAFARRSSAGAPPGDPLHALIARAHAERVLYMEVFEGNRSSPEAGGYWRREDVVTELKRAYQKFGLSLEAPLTPAMIAAKNTFGYVLAAMKEKYATKRLLKTLDRRVCDIPWAYQGLPAFTFEMALADGDF